MSTETKTRAESVSAEDFLRAYIPLQKQGLSRKQIAEKISMNESSMNTKLSNLTGQIEVGTSTYKVGDETMTGEDLMEKRSIDFRAVRKLVDAKEIELVEKGRELPQPKSSRSRTSLASLGSIASELMDAVDSEDEDETDADATDETDGETEDETEDETDAKA